MSEAQFTVEHVAKTPPNWRVRTVATDGHEVRIAFPPGPRRKGSGQVVEILHPKKEKNPCEFARSKNPLEELVIFGNPSRFQQLEREISSESRARRYPLRSAAAVAASIGRRKYGAEKFQRMARAGRRRAARGNPEGLADAEALFQEFHGRDPEEILKVQRSAAMRKTYVACGPLLAIGIYTPGIPLPKPTRWEDYPGIDFSEGVDDDYNLNAGGVMLSANPEGTQLYAIGGDQDLDGMLEDLGVDASKDLVALCEAAFVVYFDEKPHTGFKGVEYMHEFDQPRPVVGYDRLKKEIFFVGGRYEVKGNWLEH